MPKGYRSYLPDQDLLLPPNLHEWVAEEHLVYFVSDVVDQLDLSAIQAVEAKAATIRSAPDNEVIVQVLHGRVQFAPDPRAVAGGHPL